MFGDSPPGVGVGVGLGVGVGVGVGVGEGVGVGVGVGAPEHGSVGPFAIQPLDHRHH